ncbi:hypothetical protein NC651_000934 [Populus alba x Populus x berolinensis]|nr:hypothetical protein NC651_000934 [Populus alba x Populus x berolinensis]
MVSFGHAYRITQTHFASTYHLPATLHIYSYSSIYQYSLRNQDLLKNCPFSLCMVARIRGRRERKVDLALRYQVLA